MIGTHTISGFSRPSRDLGRAVTIPVQHVDTQLNIAMRTVSGALRLTNINWLPVLSNIEPPQIRRDRVTLQEYKKAQQLTDCVPIKEILREPTMSRLRYRRPFVVEAARLASLIQTEQQT